MKYLPRFVRLNLTLIMIGVLGWAICGTAAAAGTATLTLSPSSGSYHNGSTFSLVVYENSSTTAINTVEADLAYNAGQLQYVSSSMSSNFTTAVQNSGGNGLTCFVAAALGTSMSGNQAVETVTFKAITSGNTTITFISGHNNCSAGSTGSAIITSANNANIWNGVTTGGSYTLQANSVAPTPTPKLTATSKKSTPTPASTSTSTVITPSAKSSTQASVAAAAVPTSYMVAIKLVDSDNHIVQDVKVTLDNSYSAVTDTSGIASFSNVSPGQHTIKAVIAGKTDSQFITVKGLTSMGVQTLNMKLATPSASKPSSAARDILIGVIVLVVLLVIIGLLLKRRLDRRSDDYMGSAPPGPTPIVSGSGSDQAVVSDLSVPDRLATDDQQAVGAVFQPVEPTNQPPLPPAPNNAIVDEDINHGQ